MLTSADTRIKNFQSVFVCRRTCIDMLIVCYLTLIILGCCILAQGRVVHNDDHMEEKAFNRRVGKFFSKRCTKHGDLEKLEEVLRELEQLKECFLKTLPDHLSDDEEQLRSQCLNNRKEVIKCMERLLEKIAPCLPPEESYLPEFLMESYEGYSEYLCEHIRTLTFTGLLETNLAKCVNRFVRHKEYNPHYVCFETTKFANHTHEGPITKTELCADLVDVHNCYEKQFKAHCADAPKAWEFQEGLLNGLSAPCKKTENETQ